MKKAIIVDIDNTLTDSSYLTEFIPKINTRENWDDFHKMYNDCEVNEWCLNLIQNYISNEYFIIFLTGREARNESLSSTIELIDNLDINEDSYLILMRAENDYREDHIVKESLLTSCIIGRYDVELAIDDKEENCQLFKKYDIPTLKVV